MGELIRFVDALDYDRNIQIIGGVDKHLEMYHQLRYFSKKKHIFASADNTSKLKVDKYEFDSMLFIIPNK